MTEQLDLGDWIGVTGILFRTKTNELTVEVHELTFLSKALRPLAGEMAWAHRCRDPLSPAIRGFDRQSGRARHFRDAKPHYRRHPGAS